MAAVEDYTVTILPGGRRIPAEAGETLLSALRRGGVFLNAPCGGQGLCHKCGVTLEDGPEALACRTVVTGDLSIRLPAGKMRVLTGSLTSDAEAAKEGELGLSFDIGTTTLAGYLVRRETGAVVASLGAVNPQTSFGADVITRLAYADEFGGAELTRLIRASLGRLGADLIKKANVTPERVTAVAAVGNTAMHHLYLGLPTGSLSKAPFIPAETEPFTGLASDFGFAVRAGAPIYLPPPIAGFVGADTVACILDTGLDAKADTALLIDIGTNGELVLAHEGHLTACSAAAGPAFEGARITMGLRAEPGAIDRLTYSVENGYAFSVIGDAGPRGLCGSGLLDTAALLKKLGLITGAGRLLSKAEAVDLPLSDRLVERNGQSAFLLSTREDGGEVFCTQGDIREFQLAKGALRAAMELLCASEGIKPSDIDRVLIAGAFGCYLNNWSAVRIGLYPDCFLTKLSEVGNAAGGGAIRLVSEPGALTRAASIARDTKRLNLASDPNFLDAFIDAMAF